MTRLNWILGIVAAVVWIGPVIWYFNADLRTFWSRRNDKWFRED